MKLTDPALQTAYVKHLLWRAARHLYQTGDARDIRKEIYDLIGEDEPLLPVEVPEEICTKRGE